MEEYRRLCRWEDNIERNLKEIDGNVMRWTEKKASINGFELEIS